MELIDGLAANTTRGTTSRILALLKEHPRGRVLDAPAGTGALAKLLARSGHRVVALELEAKRLEVDGISQLAGDMREALPFADGVFDYAVCCDGIEHFENPYLAARELARVLRPGGELVISTPNISSFRSRARYLMTGFHNKGKTPLHERNPSPLHHISLMTFAELRYALHRHGLRLHTIATNRTKLPSLPYALLYPFVALATLLAFRHEKDPTQGELNREIWRQMLSWPVAMGETLIVSATKQSEPSLR